MTVDLESLVRAVQQATSVEERQRRLNPLIYAMQQSGKIWRGGGSIDLDGYEEALQKTWLYFCKNIDAYDPDKAQVLTWFNNYLRYRIKDYNIEQWEEAKRRMSSRETSEPGEFGDLIERIPDRGDIPPILEQVRGWLETEPLLLTIHLRQRPDVHCQMLLLRRLPPETPWKALSQEFKVPIPTLSNFYQQRCFPHLRDWGMKQGYLTRSSK